MTDYQPLDLAAWCNAGVSFLPSNVQSLLGDHEFHGLPFRVGASDPNPASCFLGFSPEEVPVEPVTVSVGSTARHVLFAHTVLDSRILQGESVGHVIAEYVFRYADGEEVSVPIRERFEIHIVPTTWGQWPFLAHGDRKDGLMPRHEGPWNAAGRRQAEAVQGGPRAYYLWAWANPRPDVPLESITIRPGDRKFLVAAITLGHADEWPFVRTPSREVKITLPRPEDASQSFGLEVEVDRGVATYPFALPEQSPAEFLEDDFKGWGEAQNERSGQAYVEIAAIPSATVTVKHHGEELGHTTWGELQDKGKIAQPRVHLEVVDKGKNWVHVTVLDDETGRPVPCRVHFRSPAGIPYQPHGYHNHVNRNLETWHQDIGGDLRLGQITYAYIDGKCQGWLPRGEVIVDVARGFEYEPLRSRVRIQPGQRELTLRLKRWTHMNRKGWYSGDTHVHFLGTQGAHREAQGEDLNVVNLLQSQWGHLFTNTEDFTGAASLTNEGNTIVYCSQENRQHLLGHLTLLGLKEPVMPWCTDGPSESEIGGAMLDTMSRWADACHAQGGTVVIPHLPNPNGEPTVLIATGRADAVEIIRHGMYEHLEYYRYLNCGYRLPLVGGTDKMSSDVPVGLYRTYALLDPNEEFTYDAWCAAVRAGRTFLSGGPMIHLTVDGVEVGDTIRMPSAGTVEVEAWAESTLPIHSLEIIQQGRVIGGEEDWRGARKLHAKETVKVDGNTWFAARCGGPGYNPIPHHDVWKRGMFAHTSPIYVAVGGEWDLFDPKTAQYMLTLVEGGLSYIRNMASHHPHGTVTHHHHDDDHQHYLEEPFHEAAAAIHKRMHQMGIPH